MRKILLADDSVTAQNMGRKILADAGYEVLTVNNGSAALKRITEAKPDVIILDVYMPGYSGLELCQRLKDSVETSHIPVLLSVGKLEPFKPQEARRVKANAHIVKPFEASELLTAIARLEDSIVPQARRRGFSAPPSAVGEDDFTKSNADLGRRNSFQFSAAKKKEEPEPDHAGTSFRDFRKAKGNASASSWNAAAQETIPPAAEGANWATEAAHFSSQSAGATLGQPQHAETVPEMPRGITKEELDALSAVAAKLDEPTVATAAASAAMQEGIPSTAEEPGPLAETAPVSTQATDAHLADLPAATEEPTTTPSAETRGEEKIEAPVPAVEAPQSAVMAENAVEIPAEQIEPASEVTAATEQPDQIESQPAQVQQLESQPVESQQTQGLPVSAEAVNRALFAVEPASIDREDEPIFASAFAGEQMEAQAAEIAGYDALALETEGAPEKKEAEDQVEEASREESSSCESAPEVSVASGTEQAVEADVPAPSDDELAEALRLLTPAAPHAEATVPSEACAHETCENSGHQVDADADSVMSTVTCWLAEAVGLTPEEAAMSLEGEMFRSFASAPTAEIESAPAANRVETITAAVENRLAEASQPEACEASEAPKAMAAAAAKGSATASSATASEDSEIASIVDKVLADLRPKIVEEITKKLGKNH